MAEENDFNGDNFSLPEAFDTEPSLFINPDTLRTTAVSKSVGDKREVAEMDVVIGDHNLMYGKDLSITKIEKDWGMRKAILEANLRTVKERSTSLAEFCKEFGADGSFYNEDEMLLSITTFLGEFGKYGESLTHNYDITNKIFDFGNSLKEAFEDLRDPMSALQVTLRSLGYHLDEKEFRSMLNDLAGLANKTESSAENLITKLKETTPGIGSAEA